MKALRIIIAILWASSSLSGLSQNQLGFVKTLGRPNQKGKALSGVSVRAKGAHNAVLSKNDGTFTMVMTGKKDGDSYALQQVQKTGYELNDVGMIGRQYAFSTKVPITIVMVSQQQLQEDKLRIENKAYEKAEKNYKDKLAILEQQKRDNLLTKEKYRQLLQDLQNSFSKYESLIGSLAEHYARTDYDDLDEKEREINLCIEEGELERADSLLQKIGIQKRIENIALQLSAGQKLMDDARNDLAKVLKQQQKDAEYLYQLYTIKLGQFNNDSAKYFIELRAELDTTNVKWQLDAAEFVREYMTDFKKANFYNERAIRHAEKGSNNMVSCFLSMGDVFYYQGKYAKARQLYVDAQLIKENLFGKSSKDLVEILCRLGNIASAISKWDKSDALNYYQQGLEICINTLGNEHPDIATCHYCIGLCYFSLSELHSVRDSIIAKKEKQKSFEAFTQAKSLWEKQFGGIHTYIAHCDKALGDYYHYQRDFDKAIEYTMRAMNMWKRIFGHHHTKVADAYYALGSIYSSMNNFEKGLEYYKQALAIRSEILGDNHPTTVTVRKSIKSIEKRMKRKQDNLFEFSPLFDALDDALDGLKF